jgi:hypothetical protein
MQYYRRKPLNLTTPRSIPLHVDLSGYAERTSPLDSAAKSGSKASPSDAPASLMQPAKETVSEPLMADSTALVQQAASILAEELTMGVPSMGIPSTPTLETDTHLPSPGLAMGSQSIGSNGLLENVRSFVDRFASVMAQRPLPQGITPNLEGTTADGLDSNHIPLVRSAHSVRAGEVAHLTFKVHNDSDRPVQVQFFGTDLIDEQGNRIPSSAVAFTPQPVSLEPDMMAEVQVRIDVPLKTPANTYFGIAIASNLPDLTTAIELTV